MNTAKNNSASGHERLLLCEPGSRMFTRRQDSVVAAISERSDGQKNEFTAVTYAAAIRGLAARLGVSYAFVSLRIDQKK